MPIWRVNSRSSSCETWCSSSGSSSGSSGSTATTDDPTDSFSGSESSSCCSSSYFCVLTDAQKQHLEFGKLFVDLCQLKDFFQQLPDDVPLMTECGEPRLGELSASLALCLTLLVVFPPLPKQ